MDKIMHNQFNFQIFKIKHIVLLSLILIFWIGEYKIITNLYEWMLASLDWLTAFFIFQTHVLYQFVIWGLPIAVTARNFLIKPVVATEVKFRYRVVHRGSIKA